MVSRRFVSHADNNLGYWLEKTAHLRDEEIPTFSLEAENIFLAIQIGLRIPECAENAIQAVLQVFRLVELLGYWQEWVRIIQQALEISIDPSDQVRLKNQLGFLYRLNGKLDKAIATHQEAAAQAQQIQDLSELARIYFNLGTDYREGRDYEAAEQYAQLAQKTFELSDTVKPRNQAALANLLGLIRQHQGDYTEALTYYQAAIPLWEASDQTAYLVRTLMNMGFALEKLNRYEEALQMYDRATQILDDAGMELEKASIAINRGNIYFLLKQWSKAVRTYQSADTLYLYRSGDLKLQATIATNLGNLYLELDEWVRAAEFLKKAIDLWQQNGDEVMLGNALKTLGDVRLKQEQFTEAYILYEEAHQLLEHYPQDAFAQKIKEICAQRLIELSGNI